MEKEIVEELCREFGKSEKLIRLMVRDTLNENYSIVETKNLISDFYDKKSMQ